MDVREHYISSLFFHIIAILLVAAVSYPHSSAPGTLTVLLSGDASEESPVKGRVRVEEVQDISRIPPVSDPNVVADATKSPSEEKVTAGEKPEIISEAETIPEASGPVSSGLSSALQDADWFAQIHHTYVIHARSFMDSLSWSMRKGLLKEIQDDKSGGLREGSAEVIFYFNDEGGIGEIWGATNSEVFKSALDRLDWQSVPLPGTYRLKIKGLHVRIRVNSGEPSFSYTLL